MPTIHRRALWRRTLFAALVVLLILVSLPGLSERIASAAGEEVRGELNGWGATPWLMSNSLGGTFIYSTGQVTTASDSFSEFKFFKSSNLWYGNGQFVTFGQIFGGLSTAGGNSGFSHTQNRYYVYKWNGNDRGVIFQLDGAAANITGVSHSPAVVTSADSVSVNATLSGPLPGGQAVWLRYTTNNFATSSVIKMTGSGVNYSATIPAQAAGASVIFYIFTSGDVAAIAPGDADLMTINAATNSGANYSYTVGAAPAPITVSGARALWLDQSVIAWNGAPGASYRLLYDPDGAMMNTAESTPYVDAASPGFVTLTASGVVNGASYPKNPNANGMVRLTLPVGVTVAQIKELLRGQVVVASYNSSGVRLDATRVQIQGVLDALYASAATSAPLGPTYSGGAPTVSVWAPTAKSVSLLRFADASTPISVTHAMAFDATSGVWSVTGDATWDRQFYLFDVEVYVPELDAVVHNLVTDPYAVTLSQDGAAANDVRSQLVNLDDADLKPAGWDTLTKPALAAPEDIVIYETHVRDFSINDTTVPAAERGTFMAFTHTASAGMQHLLALRDAGLTHIHLLPAFDIATVIEPVSERTEPAISFNPATDRASTGPQAAVGAARATDGFNWGYDPYHYGAPEGAYATDPNGVARIREFRAMMQALNANGLRVVMDVVYNHTAAVGQEEKSVLDKIVPGYYYRYDASGALYTSSCCADTATEYAMMEDLMIDTLVRWATAYKVDGFRFDLMNLHTRQNMLNVQSAIQAIDPTIYLYGEGWDFGSAVAKGLTACPNCYAKQTNMTGVGIGLFNDKIRDAAHGGFSTDPLQIRQQGFINGLHTDWNGYCYANRFQSNLRTVMDILRSGLRASGTDWNGQGQPFTDDPQEAVNYVEKHDNETLFDQNIFKLPNGPGDPGACGGSYVPPVTSMTDRVRVQNLGTSLIGLAQGIPFFQLGQDMLRSKSLDRNSYDSGDWFNKVDFTYSDNNFGKGLPPSWDNATRWGIMTPLLNNPALSPTTGDIQDGRAHLREILRIRQSSPLFRLRTEAEVNARVSFYNAGATPQDALIIMALNDNGAVDLDPNYETILVFFNAHKISQSFTIPNANGFSLHPVHIDAIDADAVVQSAVFNDATDTFTIPARTTAVFVSNELILPVSTIDFVGLMFPRGGVATLINEGAFAPAGLDVFVQVYEAGVTEAPGQGAGIACYLHWGKFGEPWTDQPMSFNTQIGNNDEYKATLPQAVINGLAAGTYGFTTYCQRPGEGKKWKQDIYNINGVATDDDQGDSLITIIPAADSSLEPAGGVFVHLFEWKWDDVARECTYLASKGYTGVQVSPPMEHVPPVADMGDPASDYPWWVRYQPVTHDTSKLVSRSGSLADFQAMVNACNAVGVAVIVDAVINHTTGVGSGTGTAGSSYTPYSYPQYTPADFNACGTTGNEILDYKDRNQVQRCELVNLADLNTGKASVQNTLRAYMQALLNMGVKGFRIDAAKHIPAHELAAILNGLTLPGGGRPYIFQEVIDQDASERIRDSEYTPYGDVTEFGYSVDLGYIFNAGALSSLQNFTAGFLPSRFAVVFTDNHDNQRGHGAGGAFILDHRDGFDLYNLGNIFMLAYPYGHPAVMSSYYWSNNPASNAGDSKGPPSATPPYISGSGPDTRSVYGPGQTAGDMPVNCADTFEDGKWVCEHRRTPIANMVGFRQATVGELVVNWVNVSANHIAFGRGTKGYVAINRESTANTRTYITQMPAGYYCDVTHFDYVGGQCVLPNTAIPAPVSSLIRVEADGSILNRTVAGMSAFAIHAGATVPAPAPEIEVRGAGQLIANGATTPNFADGTDFGAVPTTSGSQSRTFVINNIGNVDLALGSVSVNNPAFGVSIQPASLVAPGAFTTFELVFDPSTVGVVQATVTISNNDGDENPYTFVVAGEGLFVNSAPVAFDSEVSTPEDTPVVIPLIASDADGQSLNFAVTQPAAGVVTLIGATATYTPPVDFNGQTTFTFLASDGLALSNSATVTVTVTPVNDAPVANAASFTTAEDAAVNIVLSGSDVDGDSLSYTVLSQPSHGALSGAAPNLLYTPDADYHGSDSFTFRVSDGQADSEPATVSITVTPVNDAPTANDQTLTTEEDTPLDILLTGNDVDGDALDFSVTTNPVHGVLSGSAPTLTYTPAPNYNGDDSFTFTVCDPAPLCATGTVTLTVGVVNDAPVAQDAAITTNEDTPVSILLGASDVDNDPLTFTVVDAPQHGVLGGIAPTLIYTPNADYHGSDSFTFRANDGQADSNLATVTITVLPINDAPTATGQSVTTAEDTPLAITLTGGDVDGDSLAYGVLTPPTHGALSGTAPNLTYTPNANYHGVDSFTFQVSDGVATSQPAIVSITVTPVNDAPVAANRAVATTVGAAVAITLVGSDVDGDVLTFSVVTPPTSGVLSGVAPNLTYTPNPGFAGSDSFTYRANDGQLDSNVATVTISVSGGYAFTGFFQPVDNLPTVNTVNAGSAIPVKFSLGGNFGLNILAAGSPNSQPYACTSGAATDAIEQTVTAGNSSLQYDPVTDTYTYVWKTDKAWAGTCRQLNVVLADGSVHSARFRFNGKARAAEESASMIFLPVVQQR
jgi:pullulanase-type alpha-1,6-glucosidase